MKKNKPIIELENIKEIYGEYLANKNYMNQIQRRSLQEKDGEKFLRPASWAGHCAKKHKYLEENVIPDTPKYDDLSKLRLGTLIHQDILKSLINNPNLKNIPKGTICLIETPVELDVEKVRGSADVVFIRNSEADIKDFKSMSSFPWKRKFGLTKNRDLNPSRKYEFQIGTYALGVNYRYGVKTTNMEIVYYKKDTSVMKSEGVSLNYIDKAEEYWMDINKICEKKLEEIIPGETMHTPVEQWECNYCPFAYICDSPFITKRLNAISTTTSK